MVTDSETEKTKQKKGELVKVGKSNANVPDTRAQQARLLMPRITRNTKNVKPITRRISATRQNTNYPRSIHVLADVEADGCCTDEVTRRSRNMPE